ncbi:hypothetical protein GCM10009750_34990 [Agromyces salentinus]|uniref:Uncharacterized protein n=1 Tax=Agromyces salentinus TaxID=269421 RepID=A0ABP4Z9Q7_9MICO
MRSVRAAAVDRYQWHLMNSWAHDESVITSADEYKRWFDAPQSNERVRKLREPASQETWVDIIQRFPECRAEVAWSRHTPVVVLKILRWDADERTRWRVRTNARWIDEHPDDALPWEDDPSVPIQFRLSDQERQLLQFGLTEWSGPAKCTHEFAVAMGFRDVEDLFIQGNRIGEAIVAGEPLSRTDWTKALLSTEVVFMSNVIGSGWDWETTTGLSDESTLQMIRALQRKIVTGGVIGHVFGTRVGPAGWSEPVHRR